MASEDMSAEIKDEELEDVAGGKKRRRSWRKPQWVKCPSCGIEFDRGAAMECPRCGAHVDYPED